MGSPEGELSETKRQLRLEMRERRAEVPGDVRASFVEILPTALAAIAARDALPDTRLARVALYAGLADEAPVDSLFALLSATGLVAFPRVAGSQRLDFHLVARLESLVPGAFGVLEPVPSAPVVLPGALTLIVVPGLAFDRRGGRLGWGRGFYDAALVKHPDALRVGVCYSTQLIDAVPTDEWDVAVDQIITEEGVIQCKPCT